MRNISKDYSISRYPAEVEVITRLVSISNRMIAGIQKYMTRTKQKRAEARLHTYYRKRIQKQLQQNTVNQIPLEMKLRMGFHRS